MDRKNIHHLLLVVGFVLMIGVVGVVQGRLDVVNDEPIQALELFEKWPSAEDLRAYEADMSSNSWLEDRLRPPFAYGRYLVFDDVGDEVVLGRDDWWFYRTGVRYLVQRADKLATDQHGLDAAYEAIIDLRDQLRERGIELLMVPVPCKAEIYPDQLTARLMAPIPSKDTTQLIDRLREADVNVVDLYKFFEQRRRHSDEPLYLARDTHWTPEGAECAAEYVAEDLLSRDWNIKGETAYDVREVTVLRRGDVLEMIKVDRVEARFSATEITCRQVVHRATGELYSDEDTSPVLVLGDSFLRIYERDEPGSAGFIAHLARRLAQPVSSIVSDGGASTRVRKELKNVPELLNPKRVVIWEFVDRDIRFGNAGWQRLSLPASGEVRK